MLPIRTVRMFKRIQTWVRNPIKCESLVSRNFKIKHLIHINNFFQKNYLRIQNFTTVKEGFQFLVQDTVVKYLTFKNKRAGKPILLNNRLFSKILPGKFPLIQLIINIILSIFLFSLLPPPVGRRFSEKVGCGI